MPGVFPDLHLGDMLDAYLGGVGALTAHLAKNNVSITRASVLADFVEANYSGYAAVDLSGFGVAVYDGVAHSWASTADPILFQNSTGVVGNTIYAVYWTDGSGHLVYAEEVTGAPAVPVDMMTAGKTFVYTPTVEMLSEFSASP